MRSRTRKVTATVVAIFFLIGTVILANPVMGENLIEEIHDEMERENTDTGALDLVTGISDNSDSTYEVDTGNEQIDESNETDVIENDRDDTDNYESDGPSEPDEQIHENEEKYEDPEDSELTGDGTQYENLDDSDESIEPENPKSPDEPENPQKESELTDDKDDEDGDTQYENPAEDFSESQEPEGTEDTELPTEEDEEDNMQIEPEAPENPEEPTELPGIEEDIEPVIPIEELPIIPLLVENPALKVYLYTDRDVYRPGETIEFKTVLKNTGDVDLENVIVYVKSSFGMIDGLIGTLRQGEETTFKGKFKIEPGFKMEYLDIETAAKGMYLDTMVMAADSYQVGIMIGYDPFIELTMPPGMDMQSLMKLQLLEEEVALDYGPPKSVFLPEFVKLASTDDTIAVYKTAEPSSVCRTYNVELKITGEPPDIPVDVVLVIDRSGSMDAGNPSSMYYAKKAAKEFTDNVLADSNNRVAVVSFAGPKHYGNYGAATDATQHIGFSNNAESVKSAINSINTAPGTNIQAGFLKAKSILVDYGRENANKVIILLTDGVANASIGNITWQWHEEPTVHNAHTIAAYNAGQSCHNIARVFTVGLFNQVPNQSKTIAREILQWAQNAGCYITETAPDLSPIYQEISSQLGYSATNAVVTDVIHGDFELVEGSITPNPNAPWSYDIETQTITWNPGTITTLAKLTYKIRAKDGVKGNDLHTNVSAVLNYTNINETPDQQKTFPDPKVNVIGVDAQDDLTIVIADSVNISDGLEVYGYSPFQYKWTSNTDPDWSFSGRDPGLQYPEEDTIYTIEVTDSYGCKATDSFLVIVKKGKIKIIKIVKPGIGGIDTDKEFVVHVDGPSGKEWNTFIKHQTTKQIGNLWPGNYYITEVVPMDYSLISIENSLGTKDEINLTRQMIEDDEVVIVTVSNRRVNDSWFRDETEADNYFTVDVSWSSQTQTKTRNTQNQQPFFKEENIEAVLQDDREYIIDLPEENEDEIE